MKVLRFAIAILVIMCLFIGVHSYVMANMGKSMTQKNTRTQELAYSEDWEGVSKLLSEIHTEWEKYRFWASLTISTHEIEELELSLQQAEAFAYLKQKTDFLGEFIMFSKLIEHIPHREGFHIEEIF